MNNENKVIVQELSLALFQDFDYLQSLYVQVVKVFQVRWPQESVHGSTALHVSSALSAWQHTHVNRNTKTNNSTYAQFKKTFF